MSDNGEAVCRYICREEVCIERHVTLYDVVDKQGRTDDANGQWRKRTAVEFARTITEAAEGLTDVWVDIIESHGSGSVVVYGNRPATESEIAEYDRRDKMLWLSAKGTYERGREKWETP